MKFETIVKARTHKYIRREGSAGDYTYYYSDGSGGERAASSHKDKEKAKIDHAKRLALGRRLGKHTKTDAQIAEEVGLPVNKVRNASATVSRGVHGYSATEAAEASGPASTGTTEALSGATRVVEERARRRSSSMEAAREALSRAQRVAVERAIRRRVKDKLVGHRIAITDILALHSRAEALVATPGHSVSSAVNQAFAEAKYRGIITEAEPPRSPGGEPTDEVGGAIDREIEAEEAIAPSAASRSPGGEPTAPSTTAQIESLRQALRDAHGLDLGAIEAQSSTARAQKAEAQARAAVAPTSPESRELHSVSPELRGSDAELESLLAVQASGGNPYLDQSKKIYNRTKSGVKAERKQITDHVFAAIEKSKRDGMFDASISKERREAALVENYKEISGSRIRGISGIAKEFESATFVSLDEVIENAPINVEVERMKRGYAAKQIARFLPYIKDTFKQRNPSFPPPYPTFGDIKGWAEAGGRPDWAPSRSRMAVPREVQEAAPRGPDGNIMHPPPYLPLHLAPIWGYIVKKSGEANPYQSVNPPINQAGELGDLGQQAKYQEGILLNALRKYVQQRGNNNLVDIPKSKLGEVNLTHADIFKGEADDLMKILTTKIIDNAALLPYIKEELAMMKSVRLVVDKDAIYKSKAVRKAELIEKIKTLKKSMFYVV